MIRIKFRMEPGSSSQGLTFRPNPKIHILFIVVPSLALGLVQLHLFHLIRCDIPSAKQQCASLLLLLSPLPASSRLKLPLPLLPALVRLALRKSKFERVEEQEDGWSSAINVLQYRRLLLGQHEDSSRCLCAK
jgi:hypothetical protein